ncbi:MAG: hypothetical protein EPO37_01195 [Nitrosarchaeum sp.]|nr:MAG: hypothetical protein EPO37_01195 [Nitrosarchaeum sp.]
MTYESQKTSYSMRYIVFLVLIGFAGILSTNVYAMPPFHSQEIYDFSNVIAVGKVISVDSTFSPTHNLYEIKVEKFLKNPQDSDVLFASGQKTANIRLGNQVFDVNDRGLFYLTNNTMGYDPYSGIFLVHPTSQLIEPEWDKCDIFDKEIPREHWVFGGTGQMPSIRQGNNTDIENFAIGKEVLVSYDIFNHSSDAKNVTYGIMIKKIDEPDYLYTETNNSYLLEPCVPYKTLTWTFTPTKSGQYAAEIYDLVGSQTGVGFTASSDLDSNSKVLQSPLKQFKAGIPIYEIQCKEEFELAFKASDDSPACVKPETKIKLIERGWIRNEKIPEQEDKIITPKDNDKLIDIKKGESFVVKLDSSYDWRIDIDNKTVVDSDYSDIRYSGSQGVYRAHNSGQAILTGIGDPLCRLSEPPCASPSILFQLNINVR